MGTSVPDQQGIATEQNGKIRLIDLLERGRSFPPKRKHEVRQALGYLSDATRKKILTSHEPLSRDSAEEEIKKRGIDIVYPRVMHRVYSKILRILNGESEPVALAEYLFKIARNMPELYVMELPTESFVHIYEKVRQEIEALDLEDVLESKRRNEQIQTEEDEGTRSQRPLK